MTLIVGVQLGDVALVATDERWVGLSDGGKVTPRASSSKMTRLRDGWIVPYGPGALIHWTRALEGWPFGWFAGWFRAFRSRFGPSLDRLHNEIATGDHPMGLLGIHLTLAGPRIGSIDASGSTPGRSLEVILPGDMLDDVENEAHVLALADRLGTCGDVAAAVRAVAATFIEIEERSEYVGGRLEIGLILPHAELEWVAGHVVAEPGEFLRHALGGSWGPRIELRPIVCCEGPWWRRARALLFRSWRRARRVGRHETQPALTGQEEASWT